MKILCPAHADTTPSLHLYKDGAYCHVCHYRCNLEDLKDEIVKRTRLYKSSAKTKTDVQTEILRIQGLILQTVRGLHLPTDQAGFYIVWPDKTYYKLRTRNERVRYVGPKGIKPTLFRIEPKKETDTIIVIEGELNALSLAKACPEHNFVIASPGAASELGRWESVYRESKNVYLVMDSDPAGISSGYMVKESLLRAGKNVILILVDPDFNQVLQDSGPKGLREYWEELIR